MRVGSKSRILYRRDLALELAPGAKRQAWNQRDADDPFHVVGEPQKIADVVAAALGFVKEIAGRRVAVGRSECENLVFGDGGDELVSLTVDFGLDQLVLQLRCVHHGAPTSSGLLRSLGKGVEFGRNWSPLKFNLAGNCHKVTCHVLLPLPRLKRVLGRVRVPPGGEGGVGGSMSFLCVWHQKDVRNFFRLRIIETGYPRMKSKLVVFPVMVPPFLQPQPSSLSPTQARDGLAWTDSPLGRQPKAVPGRGTERPR